MSASERSTQIALAELRVSDAMHRGVLTCPLDAPLAAVARMMATRRIHCVVVQGGDGTDAGKGRLWGVVSDRDLLEAIADGDVAHATAGGTVRSPAVTVSQEETLIEAARLMSSTGVTHLVAVDENDRPLGVLSTLDLAAALGSASRLDDAAVSVEQLMTAEVVMVSPETPLRDVATLLVERRISGVPVVRDGDVVGIISEGDIVSRERRELPPGHGLLAWLLNRDEEARTKLIARTAGEAMTSPAVTIEPWRPAASAAALMLDRGVKRLPVVGKGRLVGIVTRADLVRAFARSDAAIERDIREEVLRRSYWMAPDAIQVTVRDGDVTLAGVVENEAVLETLPGAVTAVPGVISVRSELRLAESGEGRSQGPRRLDDG